MELPLTPQLGWFSNLVLGSTVVVVVFSVVEVVPEMEMMSPEAAGELSPKLSPTLSDLAVVVVVAPGNIDGQIAAPMAPIAMPTGKAIDSSWRVSLLS